MSKIIQKGYCVLSNTISGIELVWRTGEGDKTEPEMFQDEREARESILEDLEEEIRQYREEEREWEEINWPEDEYSIGQIMLWDNGEMKVWDETGREVISTTLTEWRASL